MDKINYIITLAIEEMSELTKALCKYNRLSNNDVTCVNNPEDVHNNIMEEIADVEICIEWLKQNLGLSRSVIEEIKQIKKNRTKQRLNKTNNQEGR